MTKTLVINGGEFEFSSFEQAVSMLQEVYGYEGYAWDIAVSSGDFDILCYFLNDDGIDAEMEDSE